MQDPASELRRINLLRLYEKWFEQRLERGFGRYTEPKWVQKAAFWLSRDHVTVVRETFHTVSSRRSVTLVPKTIIFETVIWLCFGLLVTELEFCLEGEF